MMMENRTELGMNRTGMQVAPEESRKMMEVTDMTRPSSPGDGAAIAEVRTHYIRGADPVGSSPTNDTESRLEAGGDQAPDNGISVLIDKLGERLAFERSGTRIYEALITKCQASPDGLNVDQLKRFCAEEAKHFQLVAECIESLGADPTVQTPCADVTGVESAGLMQVVSDPKTTVNQSLHAILVAELADNAGWEELILLTREMGQEEMTQLFEKALEEEREHLKQVRQWHEQAILQEARLAA
jgi:ferritin-like metal-binding protein YciE